MGCHLTSRLAFRLVSNLSSLAQYLTTKIHAVSDAVCQLRKKMAIIDDVTDTSRLIMEYIEHPTFHVVGTDHCMKPTKHMHNSLQYNEYY